MLDSIALNVVVSLVFIYLLYSLLVTTINEVIASLFKLRSKTLEKGIKRMLTDNNDPLNSVFKEFYNQPLIKYLAEDNSTKPSYLKAASFSKNLIDLCKDLSVNGAQIGTDIQKGILQIKVINPETGKYLESLLIDANHDVDKFRTLVENWFDETMERATGWYKKQTQIITFVVAFVIAISFNVDTISITNKLTSDPKLAIEMANTATKYYEANHNDKNVTTVKDSTAVAIYRAAKKQATSDIKDANSILGLGWSAEIRNSLYLPKSFLGWILTAFAISLGAPFWFDLLNKVVLLRGSKKTEDAATVKIEKI